MEPKKPDHFTAAKVRRFEIKEEAERSVEMRIVKLDVPTTPHVADFELPRIAKKGDGDYGATKAKYGALAATDPEKVRRGQKDNRFSLNSLLREPLSVEQEEQRVIEERVKTQVEAVTEKAKSEAAAIGYRDGLAKGHEEAFMKFQVESKERMAEFEKLMASAEEAKREIFRANERFLVEMVFRIARMVLLRELTTDREYILRLCTELIERVGVRENIKLGISAEDAQTLSMLKEGIEKKLGAMSNLSIEVSNQIARGGCTVETQWNAIDASIDGALKGIADSLIGRKSTAEDSA